MSLLKRRCASHKKTGPKPRSPICGHTGPRITKGLCKNCATPRFKELHRNWYLKNTYGLIPQQYDKMLEWQHGVCAICQKPPRGGKKLHVDHDHVTNRVRCLVCNHCNRILIGPHTTETARRVLQILESQFDGRKL